MKKLNTNEFIEKSIRIHGNKYDYSKSNYIGSRIKICIICKEHGKFWQEPAGHIRGDGCKRCASKNRALDAKTFIEQAIQIHGNMYDYSRVNYINYHTKVCIVCKNHGKFWQIPNHHISMKAGCKQCGLVKKRIFRINQISKDKFNGHQIVPSWNSNACYKIDEYGKQFGYNFQHAMNGGEFHIKELGYFVDGYDKERNTVIEYYESFHKNNVQKDFERENEICNYLGCDFIILWEK